MARSYSSIYSMHVFTFTTGTIMIHITRANTLHIDSDDHTLKGSTVAGCLTATGLGEKSIEF
jgi:hypothetical protein